MTNKKSNRVSCPVDSGASAWNQHPKVYINFNKDNKGRCPYCGKVFTKN